MYQCVLPLNTKLPRFSLVSYSSSLLFISS